MADIKWIKIATDIFNNKKISLIESMPEGDSIIVIWFKLLMLAGTVNDDGNVYLTKDIPYTEQMLATLFNRPIPIIQLALTTFEKFEMIEIVNDIIHVSNWQKYQNVEGMDRIREQTRLRVSKYREQKKIECNVTGNVTVTECNATDIDKEIDIDKDNNNIISSKKYEIDYQEVINYYHHFCPSLPKVTKITEARKKLINARLKDYSVDEVKTAFKLAEESDFLTGRSGKWGGANFDWIMNTNNIVKILEGNYKNKPESPTDMYRQYKRGNYDFDALERETKQK